MHRPQIADAVERLVYRVAGLPVALPLLFRPATDPLSHAFGERYWHPDGLGEWSELLLALIVSPLAISLAVIWFTWRNAAVIRRRTGKSTPAQIGDQVRLYLSAGILPPWYYIFSLHDQGAQRAKTFIQRFETKTCYFRLLKRRRGSPLNDKVRFAEYCTAHNVRCVPTLMHLDGTSPPQSLPTCDLFVKPSRGRGGRGAERWDWANGSHYESAKGKRLSSDALLAMLVARSRREPLIVQPRLTPHPALAQVTAGALPTLRVLTCLNERNEPEVMTAMLRTSFGANRTVDNLHAGGIGALIDVQSGALSAASNLGADARLGWLSAHPDTGATIEGRIVPRWEEVKTAALAAHRNFADRVVIGWDIAVLADGPIFIEGNGNPDLDILQRFMRVGLRQHRLADLLALHLRKLSGSPSAENARLAALG